MKMEKILFREAITSVLLTEAVILKAQTGGNS